jgi:hypothetical protein
MPLGGSVPFLTDAAFYPHPNPPLQDLTTVQPPQRATQCSTGAIEGACVRSRTNPLIAAAAGAAACTGAGGSLACGEVSRVLCCSKPSTVRPPHRYVAPSPFSLFSIHLALCSKPSTRFSHFVCFHILNFPLHFLFSFRSSVWVSSDAEAAPHSAVAVTTQSSLGLNTLNPRRASFTGMPFMGVPGMGGNK